MKVNKFYQVYYTKDGIMYIYVYKTKLMAVLKGFFLKYIKSGSRKDVFVYKQFNSIPKDFRDIKLSLQGTTTKRYNGGRWT